MKNNALIMTALAAAASLAAVGTTFVSAVSAEPQTHVLGTAALGKGSVTLWQRGADFGATLDKTAIASLPSTEERLDFVTNVGPYRLVEIDWHPHGHPPTGVYDVPHFDAHFYVITKAQRNAITFQPPGVAPKPSAAIVPAGYITDGSAVPQMGMHYISGAQPEFHHKGFSISQIIGYDKGRFAFVEAMFTLKFLKTNGSFHEAIAVPGTVKVDGSLGKSMAVDKNSAGGYDIVLNR